MADELTFARKASGLVRGLSTYDAFSMGAMLILPLYGIWISLQVGAGIFQGANLVISTLLMAVVFGVPAVFVWGIMSASMPRSGGEYIYNSRILHPAVAMAASFGMVTGQLYWNIYEGSWVADPSLKILGQYLGWSGLVNWVSTKSGTVICAVADRGLWHACLQVFPAPGRRHHARTDRGLRVHRALHIEGPFHDELERGSCPLSFAHLQSAAARSGARPGKRCPAHLELG
jgi:amino acid transporter